MITLTLLLIAIAILVIVGAVSLFVGGAAFVLTFGDVILAGVIIFLIVRHFVKKKHKDET